MQAEQEHLRREKVEIIRKKKYKIYLVYLSFLCCFLINIKKKTFIRIK